MHELAIAESILTSVCGALPAVTPATAVRRVEVQVGQLDAVVPETLTFMFDAIKGSHGMRQAELRIESVEVRCRCSSCSHEFEIELPLFICPACGGSDVEVLKGRGITLTQIVTEEPEGVHDGNTCRT